MKKWFLVIILLFFVAGCASLGIRSDRLKLTDAHIITALRSYDDFVAVEKLYRYQDFALLIRFSGLKEMENRAVDFTIAVTLIDPNGITLFDSYEIPIIGLVASHIEKGKYWQVVEFCVPSDADYGIYTFEFTLTDNFSGQMISGKIKFEVIGLPV